MSVTTSLKLVEIQAIAWLQKSIPGYGDIFMSISKFGDPTFMCTYYFPLISVISPVLGANLMWTFVFCEWMNMILKLFLAGDRPFWWINEIDIPKDMYVDFQQFPKTCETGAGNPSGHCMLNAAIQLVVILGIADWIKKTPYLKGGSKSTVISILWTFYSIWMGLVCLSRIYIAAHFAHQCLYGVIIGIITGITVIRYKGLHSLSKIQGLFLSSFILASVLSVFYLYSHILKLDPLWSMEKALKWCANRDYISVDSVPFYSLSRYTGISLGLGLVPTASQKITRNNRNTIEKIIIQVFLTLAVGFTGLTLHKDILSHTMTGYYVLECLLNASWPYITLVIIPKIVSQGSTKVSNKKL